MSFKKIFTLNVFDYGFAWKYLNQFAILCLLLLPMLASESSEGEVVTADILPLHSLIAEYKGLS